MYLITLSQCNIIKSKLLRHSTRAINVALDSDSSTFFATFLKNSNPLCINISRNIFFQSAEEQFKLHYVPGDTTVDITLERLEVEEGARRTISKKYLNVMAPDIVHFVFNITRTPKHGTIDILAPNKVDIVRANTTFFTSDEIESDRVVYNHDDSESRRDTFHFVAMASRGQGK